MKKADVESEEKLARTDASGRKKAKTESLDENSDEGSKEKPRSQKRVASKEKPDPEKEEASGKYHRRKKTEPKPEKKSRTEAGEKSRRRGAFFQERCQVSSWQKNEQAPTDF